MPYSLAVTVLGFRGRERHLLMGKAAGPVHLLGGREWSLLMSKAAMPVRVLGGRERASTTMERLAFSIHLVKPFATFVFGGLRPGWVDKVSHLGVGSSHWLSESPPAAGSLVGLGGKFVLCGLRPGWDVIPLPWRQIPRTGA